MIYASVFPVKFKTETQESIFTRLSVRQTEQANEIVGFRKPHSLLALLPYYRDDAFSQFAAPERERSDEMIMQPISFRKRIIYDIMINYNIDITMTTIISYFMGPILYYNSGVRTATDYYIILYT